MCRSLVTHSPTEGHLGCFQFGDIGNKAAINIQVEVFCVDSSFNSLK